MTHPRHRPLIWLALAAMFALALLPTVSHALAYARGGTAAWAEVCTPQGLRSVALAAASTDRDAAPLPAAVHLEHCPLCTLAADHPGLPPVAAQTAVGLPFDDVHMPSAAPPLRERPGCRIAQPRGPPAGA